jgi:beta-aspartyl-peptidase (threonine type)
VAPLVTWLAKRDPSIFGVRCSTFSVRRLNDSEEENAEPRTPNVEVKKSSMFALHFMLPTLPNDAPAELVRHTVVKLTCFLFSFIALLAALMPSQLHAEEPPMNKGKFALAVHGGAGTIDRNSMTPEKERAYRDGLDRALQAGYDILKKGGSSLDAVERAVRVLEDDPHFNAGKGAVFTAAGTNELDASIMDGETLKAGAVANVKHIKNPISLARLVMEKSPHVMMDGDGAEAFAKQNGIELVDQKYFFTEERWQQLQKEKDQQKKAGGAGGNKFIISDQGRHGTVGAVALDQSGNLAAATSTGGTTNKLPGRIGDSPIIGAGTYANNATCAVSATGDGEYFIRATVAHDVSALMEYRGVSLGGAAQQVLDKVGKLGGSGGLIAIDQKGNISQPFNTSGMYRGSIDESGKTDIAIYR